MKTVKLVLSLVIALALTSCGIGRMAMPSVVNIELTSAAHPVQKYYNLNRGINLVVNSQVNQNTIVDDSELDTSTRKLFRSTTFNITPTVRNFVESTMGEYIREMGISLNGNTNSDYRLRVDVREFKIVRGTTSGRATVVLDYSLYNSQNQLIFNKEARGRFVTGGAIVDAIRNAYDAALNNMDWQAIADALTTHGTPAEESQRQVRGYGDTALEHTVIRWFIDSTPKGADVSWRVVSSTPDVKNTNSTYVGTTPYETTESFDIRGLKMENSGNIQIEVTCEKPGYLPQKRRFNLRQAIEQKEISAKFNLIKDE